VETSAHSVKLKVSGKLPFIRLFCGHVDIYLIILNCEET